MIYYYFNELYECQKRTNICLQLNNCIVNFHKWRQIVENRPNKTTRTKNGTLWKRTSVSLVCGDQRTAIIGAFSTRRDQEVLFHGLVIISLFSAFYEFCLLWSLTSITSCKSAVWWTHFVLFTCDLCLSALLKFCKSNGDIKFGLFCEDIYIQLCTFQSFHPVLYFPHHLVHTELCTWCHGIVVVI